MVAPVGDEALGRPPDGLPAADPRPAQAGRDGPVAQSAMAAIADFGIRAEAVRTLKKYWIGRLPDEKLELLCSKVLANDAIEQVIVGPLTFRAPGGRLAVPVPAGHGADPRRWTTRPWSGSAARGSSSCRWPRCRRSRPISAALGRDPTDVELETLAQTWSEHCSHKTLAGRIRYRDDVGRAAVREHAQGDDLRRHADRSASDAGRRTTGA